MNGLSWILFIGCIVIAGMLGYFIRVLQNEIREFVAMQERDDNWDDEHGVKR